MANGRCQYLCVFTKGVFMFNKDFLVRQIELMTESIACLVLDKETTAKYVIRSEVNQAETDLFYALICDLVTKKRINEAENLLFNMLDPDNRDHLAIATDFYSRLNSMTEKELDKADFSRNEIAVGLNEVRAIFALST